MNFPVIPSSGGKLALSVFTQARFDNPEDYGVTSFAEVRKKTSSSVMVAIGVATQYSGNRSMPGFRKIGACFSRAEGE